MSFVIDIVKAFTLPHFSDHGFKLQFAITIETLNNKNLEVSAIVLIETASAPFVCFLPQYKGLQCNYSCEDTFTI